MVSTLTEEALLYIFGEDKTILVTGTKGSGKTNIAGVIMYLLIALGYKIWTNIHIFKEENIEIAIQKKKLPYRPPGHYVTKHQNIIIVKKLSTALQGMISSGPSGKALFLDEAGIHAPADRAVGVDAKTIKDLNKVIRHFETCFILLTQIKTDVPPALREGDVDYQFKIQKTKGIHKIIIGKRKVETDDEGEEYISFPTVKTFRIPLSKYPVDGKFPTGFKIDIDLKETLDKLSEAEDSIEIMDKGVGKQIITGMIDEMEDKIGYLSTGKYAKKYGLSINTIKKYCDNGQIDHYKTPGGIYKVLDQPPVFKKEIEREEVK